MRVIHAVLEEIIIFHKLCVIILTVLVVVAHEIGWKVRIERVLFFFLQLFVNAFYLSHIILKHLLNQIVKEHLVLIQKNQLILVLISFEHFH